MLYLVWFTENASLKLHFEKSHKTTRNGLNAIFNEVPNLSQLKIPDNQMIFNTLG